MFRKHHIRITTALTPAQCAARLQQLVSRDASPVVGEVTLSTLRLRRFSSTWRSFQPVLTAQLHLNGGSTVIEGDCEMNSMARLVYSGLLIVTGLSGLLDLISEPASAVWSVGGLVAGIAILWAVQWLARDEAPFLEAFVRDAVEGGPR